MSATRINMDFTKTVVIHTPGVDWSASRAPGVERRMLEREHEESGRTTCVVRYAPGSGFPEHVHTGGEEFLVLDGVFSDEYGDYPAGTYVRNPPGSAHAPFTRAGCTIFVKLCQFEAGDRARLVTKIDAGEWLTDEHSGVAFRHLHRFDEETVTIERWPPGAELAFHEHPQGEELFILEGSIEDAQGRYETGSWIRMPPRSGHSLRSPAGCLLYAKRGHLPPTV